MKKESKKKTLLIYALIFAGLFAWAYIAGYIHKQFGYETVKGGRYGQPSVPWSYD